MKPKKYIALFLLLLCAYTDKAQQLLFNNISNAVGLPAQESYNVMQDSKGYIWISTEAGLCRYNGSYSKVFDKRNGLPEKGCYAVKEDKNGLMWILTSTNRVLNYVPLDSARNDRLSTGGLKEAPFSKAFVEQLKGSLEQGYSIGFKNDSLIISTQIASYVSRLNGKTVSRLLPDTAYGHYFIKGQNDLINVKSQLSRDVIFRFARNGNIGLGIHTETEIKKINLLSKNKETPSWRVLTASSPNGESFIAIGNLIIKIKADLSYSSFELPSAALSLYCDKQNGLWIGCLKDGVHYYPNANDLKNKTLNLKGFSVTGICVDDEKGVWCTTLEKGVFYCRNSKVICYNEYEGLNKPADLLKFEGGKLLVSGGENELIEISKEEIYRHKLDFKSNYVLSDIKKEENGWVIAGKSFIAKTNAQYGNSTLIKKINTDLNVGANELASDEMNNLYGVHHGKLLKITCPNADDIKSPLESPGKCIQYLGNSELLYGCKEGLYKLNLNTKATIKIKGIDGNVTKLFTSKAKQIWIATKDDGLFILKNDSAQNISKDIELKTESFFDITEDDLGSIWLGSNIGLVNLIPTKETKANTLNYKVKVYNTLNGLPYTDIYKVAVDKEFVYTSGTEGICKLPLTENLANTSAPQVYINTISVNNTLYRGASIMELAHNSNSLKIEVDALTFKEIGAPRLYYILKGWNDKSRKEETIKETLITLDNLPPNTYTLTIYAVNNNGIKSLKPAELHFEIQKPFWQKLWFIIVCIGGLAGIIIVTVKQITKGIRRKEEEKTRINKQLAEFQLTALQAQMNPHFIFNAINSIQTYILENEVQVAYDYLAKFSRLVRMVLNHAKEKQLSLEKELEMLNTYIELEQMRFENKFEYELKVSDKIDTYQIKVPPMLLQPYVENAIWHGLMPLKKPRKGKLKIEMNLDAKAVHIIIEDNGIGREASLKIKKTPEHKSIGMELTQERMNVLSNMPEYANAKIIVSDLHDNEVACGTRIEIILPI